MVAAGNTLRIEQITAYVCVDVDGNEGIAGVLAPDGTWMPLVCADEARVQSLRPVAEQLARATGTAIRVVRFGVREELGHISP